MRYVRLGIKGVGLGIRRVGSGITGPWTMGSGSVDVLRGQGSGCTIFVGSGTKIRNLGTKMGSVGGVTL